MILKYARNAKKWMQETRDTNTGNKSGRCDGGNTITLNRVRKAIAVTEIRKMLLIRVVGNVNHGM